MIVTAATVRIVLLTNARTSMKSRVCSTVDEVLRQNAHSVGQRELRGATPRLRLLPAVRTMNANGTMKTTTATRMAMTADDAPPPDGGVPHRSSSFRLSAPRERDDDRRHDEEEDDVAGGGEAVEAGLVLLVDDRRDHVAREAGTAAGHRPDEVERAQAADEREQMTVAVAGRTSGRVMCRKFFQAPAPSTFAASKYSCGIATMPAM